MCKLDADNTGCHRVDNAELINLASNSVDESPVSPVELAYVSRAIIKII